MSQTTSALRTRPLTHAADGSVDATDRETAVRLMAACDVAAIGVQDSGDDELAGMLAVPSLDREATCLLLDGDRTVGFVWVTNDVTGGDTFFDVFCPPGPRSAEAVELGIRTALEAARGHRESAGRAEWTARAGCWATERDYAAALEAAGLTHVRTFYRMRIESTSPDVPAELPALPDGVAILDHDDDEVRRRIWAVHQESFEGHFNFTPRPYDEWWERQSTHVRAERGWWLLTVDGVDAAICLLDDGRAQMGEGYVGIVGVRDRFRGRGLASLLLRRAFVHFRDLGRTATLLGVDSDNATGAVAVYERVGMRVAHAIHGFARPVQS